MSSLRKFLKLVHGLRNAEHFGFYGYVVRLYTPYRALLAELTVVWDAFHVLFEKEDEIFKRNPKQEETGSIRSACEEMHSAFMLIKRTVEAASYDASPTVKAASEKLAFVLGNYVKLPSVAMNEASALAINLVQDLRLPANAPAVATLGLGTHIDRLEETNEAFQELYLERAKEQESLAEQGNMREIRPLVDKAFDAFAQTLESDHTMAQATGQTTKAA
ncbi:MAG: DUF6261 family protein, partial [Tannerellaceae bacterium]|nr:DUF6261 family protein [Tannerellaceae bacterium]